MFGKSLKIANLEMELDYERRKNADLEAFKDKVTSAYIWQGSCSYTKEEWEQIQRNPEKKIFLGTKHLLPDSRFIFKTYYN